MIHHTCEQYAEHLRMPIPLAMDKAAKRRAMAGDNVVSGFAPFSRAMARRRRFQSAAGEDEPFAFDTRTVGEIMRGIIEEETFRAGGGLNLDQEVENETLLTYYPLHEPEVLEELRAT